MEKPDITKPFWIFCGQTFYASGGFNDFQSSHVTAVEAVQARNAWMKDSTHSWAHVVDIRTGKFIVEDGGQT